MNVEGFWFFEGQTAEEVWNILHDPAGLVQIIPDMHHLVKLGPTRYQFVLQPSASVLDVDELVIDLTVAEEISPDDYAFDYVVKGADQTALSGSGRIALKENPEGTQMTYTVSGDQTGPLAEIGDFLLETQVRAAFRRINEGVGQLLRGELPARTAPAAADTAKEVWLVLAGLVGLLLIVLLFVRRRQE